MNAFLNDKSLARRAYWIDEIKNLSGTFSDDAERMEKELEAELKRDGISALLDHLRTCGAIPEGYEHDSSEEKLYSKYTDAVVALAFNYIGINSVVLKLRSDSADVECVADDFSFVADAKAFRLSRTAKNQKDFKVQAMAGWKHGKPYAVVVCPIYQLPSSSSQIYQQAITRDVCILTFSHLAVLIKFSELTHSTRSVDVMRVILKTVTQLNPSKEARQYWLAINQSMLNGNSELESLWKNEKLPH